MLFYYFIVVNLFVAINSVASVVCMVMVYNKHSKKQRKKYFYLLTIFSKEYIFKFIIYDYMCIITI